MTHYFICSSWLMAQTYKIKLPMTKTIIMLLSQYEAKERGKFNLARQGTEERAILANAWLSTAHGTKAIGVCCEEFIKLGWSLNLGTSVMELV